jgi:hypothetical protein
MISVNHEFLFLNSHIVIFLTIPMISLRFQIIFYHYATAIVWLILLLLKYYIPAFEQLPIPSKGVLIGLSGGSLIGLTLIRYRYCSSITLDALSIHLEYYTGLGRKGEYNIPIDQLADITLNSIWYRRGKGKLELSGTGTDLAFYLIDKETFSMAKQAEIMFDKSERRKKVYSDS